MSKRNILSKWLWKRAEQLAASPDFKFTCGTLLEAAAFQHVRRESVKAVYVCQNVFGGWIANVVFKGLPLGLSDVIRMRRNCLCRTEQEARTTAIIILADVVKAEQEPPESDALPMFLFHGLNCPIDPVLMEKLHSSTPKNRADWQYARGQLRGVKELFEEDFSPEKFESFDRDTRFDVVCIVYDAAHQGIVLWPETQPCSPSGHQFPSAAIN
jgi:hypothetical protein